MNNIPNKSGIYCFLNKTNHKRYVGSTINLKKRYREHKHQLVNNKHHSIHLQNSFNKHGIENFEFLVLSTCPKEYLLKLEQWFIDSLKPEYNMNPTAMSSLGSKRSEETKIKLSLGHLGQKAWNKGIAITEEQRKAQSIVMTGKVSGMKGYKLTEEQRKRNSDVKKGRILSKTTKDKLGIPVIELDIKGNIINRWSTLSELAEELKSTPGNVLRAMQKKNKFKNKIIKYDSRTDNC